MYNTLQTSEELKYEILFYFTLHILSVVTKSLEFCPLE